MTHTFVWSGTQHGKTPERLRLKGRICEVLARSKPADRAVMVYSDGEWRRHRHSWGPSAAVRFENGERHLVSLRSLRRLPAQPPTDPAA